MHYFHLTATDPPLLGTRQATLPGGLRTGAPGKHVVKGKAKYRLVDEKVRYFVAPPIEDIVASPVRILRLHTVPCELTLYLVTSLREHAGETELRAKARNIWEASSRWSHRRTLLPHRSKSWRSFRLVRKQSWARTLIPIVRPLRICTSLYYPP